MASRRRTVADVQSCAKSPTSNERERGVRRYSVAAHFSKAKGTRSKITVTKSKTQPLPEVSEEQSKDAEDQLRKRSVVVRAVYSSARRSLATTLTKAESETGTKEAENPEGGPRMQPIKSENKRVTLKMAASAVQKGAKDTILGRNMARAFTQNMQESVEEKQGLVTEMERLERQKEEEDDKWRQKGTKTVKSFQGKAAFLTSLLDELKEFRNSGSSDTHTALIEELMHNMRELQMKMNALKGMYAMDRRNCVALNAAIELCVRDVQSKFGHIGETMKKLNDVTTVDDEVSKQIAQTSAFTGEDADAPAAADVVPKSSSESAAALRAWADAQADPNAAPSDSEGSFQQSDGQTEGLALPRKSRAGLWRKATLVVSLRRCLFGDTMKALHEAVQEISQAAVHSGHHAIDVQPWSADDKPATPPQAIRRNSIEIHRSKRRNHWGTLRMVNRLGAGTRASSSDHRPGSGGTSGLDGQAGKVGFLEEQVDGHELFADRDKHAPSTADTMVPSTADSFGSHSSPPRSPRHIRLSPKEYPAIGAKSLEFPMNLEDLIFGNDDPFIVPMESLGLRLKCPFPLLPMVQSRCLPPLKETKRFMLAIKKRDSTRSTLEGVLADRERRGLRHDDEEDDGRDLEISEM